MEQGWSHRVPGFKGWSEMLKNFKVSRGFRLYWKRSIVYNPKRHSRSQQSPEKRVAWFAPYKGGGSRARQCRWCSLQGIIAKEAMVFQKTIQRMLKALIKSLENKPLNPSGNPWTLFSNSIGEEPFLFHKRVCGHLADSLFNHEYGLIYSIDSSILL